MKFRHPFVFVCLFILGVATTLWGQSPDDQLVMGRLVRDYKGLKQLTIESDLLVTDMNQLCKKLSNADKLTIDD